MTFASSLHALLLAAPLLLVSCTDDSVAGGTSGAEAENAVALVVHRPGGHAAPGVLVVARPFEAMTDSVWYRSVSDSQGSVAFRLPASRVWMLEARADSFGALLRVAPGTGTVSGSIDLGRMATISGRLVPGAAGTKLVAAGLGCVATLDSNGLFRFENLPAGEIELRLKDIPTPWRITLLEGETRKVSLDSLSPGAFIGDPARALLFVDSLPPTATTNALVPIEFAFPASVAVPWNRLRLETDSGRILSNMLAASDSASRRVRLWVRTSTLSSTGRFYANLDSLQTGAKARSPFQGASQIGDPFSAYLFSRPPAGGTNETWYDLARDTVKTCCDSVAMSQMPSGNRYGIDPPGTVGAGISNTVSNIDFASSSVIAIGDPGKPDNSNEPYLGGISFRARAIETTSNTLFRLMDSSNAMLAELMRTGDTLSFITVDSVPVGTAIPSTRNLHFSMDSRWHTFAITISQRGEAALRVDGDSVATRWFLFKRTNTKVRFHLVQGGETRLGEMITWQQDRLTSIQQCLLGRPSRARVYPAVP